MARHPSMQTVADRLRKHARKESATEVEHKTGAKWNTAAADRLAGRGLFGKVSPVIPTKHNTRNPTKEAPVAAKKTPAKKAAPKIAVKLRPTTKPKAKQGMVAVRGYYRGKPR